MSHIILYICLLVLNVADYVITTMILRYGGVEENPIQLYMIDTFGNIGMLYLKMPLLVILGIILYHTAITRRIINALAAANVIYALVIIWSLYVLFVLL